MNGSVELFPYSAVTPNKNSGDFENCDAPSWTDVDVWRREANSST